jgi:hypothetical protein
MSEKMPQDHGEPCKMFAKAHNEFLGFRSDAVEVSFIRGSRAALGAGWYPTFRDHLMVLPPHPTRTGISLLSLFALFKNATLCNKVDKSNVLEEPLRIEILTAGL